jgi:hypothetical protein
MGLVAFSSGPDHPVLFGLAERGQAFVLDVDERRADLVDGLAFGLAVS